MGAVCAPRAEGDRKREALTIAEGIDEGARVMELRHRVAAQVHGHRASGEVNPKDCPTSPETLNP
jgi:hypothetical protein